MQATDRKIVITGAAGLVGQNLVTLLVEQGHTRLVAIDKHAGDRKSTRLNSSHRP